MDDAEPETPIASPPDPPQDPPATSLPHNIEVFLHAVGILLTYGRHLIDTVRQRATAPNACSSPAPPPARTSTSPNRALPRHHRSPH